MQTQSFHFQTPVFQGFPLPKRKTVCSGAGNTYNWSTLSNAQKKSILDNYILSAQSGDYECLNSWIQIFINSTGQSFGQRVDAQYAGNKKFNLANADVQELIGHAKNRLELSELYIYGSGRLGQTEPNLTLAADAERSFVYNPFTGAEIDPSTSVVPPVYTTSATHKSFVIGQKRYEISNHLGNVSTVITDRKFGVPLSSTDPTINYYLADIVTATDYDPYGQALPGRVWNRTGYRFGFNGQEFDSELGEVWSAEFWEYDASLGRRWDIDPIDYPFQSPYATFDGNPIAFSDPLGLAAAPSPSKGKAVQKGEDPKKKKSFAVLPKTNKDFGGLKDRAYTNSGQAVKNSGWVPIYATNMKNAIDKINKYAEKNNVEVDNVLFLSHGSNADADFRAGDEQINDLNAVKAGEQLKSLDIHGSIIIGACHTGGDQNGGVDFCKTIAKESGTNVIANKSWGLAYSSFNSKADSWGVIIDFLFGYNGNPDNSHLHLPESFDPKETWRNITNYKDAIENLGKTIEVSPSGFVKEGGPLYLNTDGSFGKVSYKDVQPRIRNAQQKAKVIGKKYWQGPITRLNTPRSYRLKTKKK